MSLADATFPGAGRPLAVPRPFELFCFALCVVNGVWLVTAALTGAWLWDPAGRLLSTDFVNVWAAGKLALAGEAASAYDWTLHKRAEIEALGYDFGGYYGWHYPPPYLFVASALAMLPFVPATIAWLAVSFVPYVMAVRAAAGHPAGYAIALGAPPLLANMLVGQNGFLTAALVGGTVLLLERRPVLAGVLLGLLTYKPHFGVLFPLVLMACGYGRAFASAAVTASLLALVSLAAFGSGAWIGFVQWLPVTSREFLSYGSAEIEKMQSLFALVRTLGGPEGLAWTLHTVFAAGVAAAVLWVWRNPRIAYPLKAAALATGVILATPYSYAYDLVVLAIPAALLCGLGLQQGFRRFELPLLAIATLLLLVFPFVKLPTGLAAVLIVAGLTARRIRDGIRDGRGGETIS
jgi:arabinofuranan 3-O-arabinosyltransferase